MDETGKIVSYTTETGGADTVFPFSSGKNIAFIEVQATSYSAGWTKIYWFDKDKMEAGKVSVYMEKEPKTVTIYEKIIISYNSVRALVDGVKYIEGLSGTNWTDLAKDSSASTSLTGVGSSQYLTVIWD